MMVDETIKLLFFIPFGVLVIVTALYMRQFATSPKHKVALIAPVLLIIALPLALLIMMLTGDGRYAALIVVGAIASMGLVFATTARESAELYASLRARGGIWRWIINETPKRESFLLKGWIAAVIGLLALVWFVYLWITNPGSPPPM